MYARRFVVHLLVVKKIDLRVCPHEADGRPLAREARLVLSPGGSFRTVWDFFSISSRNARNVVPKASPKPFTHPRGRPCP